MVKKRRQLHKPRKVKKSNLPKVPVLGLSLLVVGVLISVVGALTIPAILAEAEDGSSVVVSIISLIVGVPMALLGLRFMRSEPQKKKKTKP